MSRDTDQKRAQIQSRQDLLEYFRAGIKPQGARGIGMEHEKFGFRLHSDDTLEPLPYADGIEVIMHGLQRFGWEPVIDAGHVTALERDGAAITLEPGGQFELSGAIFDHLSQTEAELYQHLDETLEVSGPLNTRWLFMGAQPFHSPEALPWMPKSRYKLMANYLPTRGALAHEMMKMTCTVQANFDYTSEADAFDILRVAFHVSPIISAMFASGPLRCEAPSGDISRRSRIWTLTDPDRSGYVRVLFEEGATFEDYIDYILDIPIICIRRPEHGYIDMKGVTFREFIRDGFGEWVAEIGDWETHLSMVWPEVRMKCYIEVRSAAVVPPPLMMSMVALWKGIIYSLPARREAMALFDGIDFEAHLELHERIIRDGFAATFRGDRAVLDVARDLVAIARRGLESLRDPSSADEAHYLVPLEEEILASGRSLARQLLDDLEAGAPLRDALSGLWLAPRQVSQT